MNVSSLVGRGEVRSRVNPGGHSVTPRRSRVISGGHTCTSSTPADLSLENLRTATGAYSGVWPTVNGDFKHQST